MRGLPVAAGRLPATPRRVASRNMPEADVPWIDEAALTVDQDFGLARGGLDDCRPLKHSGDPHTAALEQRWKIREDHDLALRSHLVEGDQLLGRYL
jgi:hypothetical protein